MFRHASVSRGFVRAPHAWQIPSNNIASGGALCGGVDVCVPHLLTNCISAAQVVNWFRFRVVRNVCVCVRVCVCCVCRHVVCRDVRVVQQTTCEMIRKRFRACLCESFLDEKRLFPLITSRLVGCVRRARCVSDLPCADLHAKRYARGSLPLSVRWWYWRWLRYGGWFFHVQYSLGAILDMNKLWIVPIRIGENMETNSVQFAQPMTSVR